MQATHTDVENSVMCTWEQFVAIINKLRQISTKEFERCPFCHTICLRDKTYTVITPKNKENATMQSG